LARLTCTFTKARRLVPTPANSWAEWCERSLHLVGAEQVVEERARHEQDPILASIAATTTPIDAVAQELINMIDAHGWALLINAEIQPSGPAMPPAATAAQPDNAEDDDDRNDDEATDERGEDNDRDERDHLTGLPAELAQIMPAKPAAYERWRGLWVEISERPDATNKQLADDLATSVRTVQRIRSV
jgi:hypothetical protein